MKCKHCNSTNRLEINAKCSDMCSAHLGYESNWYERHGYAPHSVGLGGGDYIDFVLCLDCGKLQGDFPIKPDLSEFRKYDP